MGRRKRSKSAASVALGAYLRSLRKDSRLALREVAIKSGGKVSNAYISQIENGYVAMPHPRCLYALARVYRVDYWQIVRMAYMPAEGIPFQAADELFGVNGLTQAEMIACHAFITEYRKFKTGENCP